MKYTVGEAWAILKGRKSGDVNEAYKMLDEMDPLEYREINRQQGKVRARIKARVARVGQRPTKRWST